MKIADFSYRNETRRLFISLHLRYKLIYNEILKVRNTVTEAVFHTVRFILGLHATEIENRASPSLESPQNQGVSTDSTRVEKNVLSCPI